jgi:hypothetical protein
VVPAGSQPGQAARPARCRNIPIEGTRSLVQGCDLWLNAPRRPLEACGTSGQEAVFNATLNLSILDGWWAEAYDGENGGAQSSMARWWRQELCAPPPRTSPTLPARRLGVNGFWMKFRASEAPEGRGGQKGEGLPAGQSETRQVLIRSSRVSPSITLRSAGRVS